MTKSFHSQDEDSLYVRGDQIARDGTQGHAISINSPKNRLPKIKVQKKKLQKSLGQESASPVRETAMKGSLVKSKTMIDFGYRRRDRSSASPVMTTT